MNFLPSNSSGNVQQNINLINSLKRNFNGQTNIFPNNMEGSSFMELQPEPMLKRPRIIDHQLPGPSTEHRVIQQNENLMNLEQYREFFGNNVRNVIPLFFPSQPQMNHSSEGALDLQNPYQLGFLAGQNMLNSVGYGFDFSGITASLGNQKVNPLPSQMAQFLQLPNMEAGTSKQVNQSPPTSTFKKMSLNSLNPDHSRPEQNTMTNLITRPIGHLNAEAPKQETSVPSNVVKNHMQWILVESASRIALGCIIILEIGRRAVGIKEPSELSKRYLSQIDMTQIPPSFLSLLYPDIDKAISPLFPSVESNTSVTNQDDLNSTRIPLSAVKLPEDDLKVQFYCRVLKQTLSYYEQQISDFIQRSEISCNVKPTPEKSIWKKPVSKVPKKKSRDRVLHDAVASTSKLPPIQENYASTSGHRLDFITPDFQPKVFTSKRKHINESNRKNEQETESENVDVENVDVEIDPQPGTSKSSASQPASNLPTFSNLTPELLESLIHFIHAWKNKNEIPLVQSTSSSELPETENIIRSVNRNEKLPAPIPVRPFEATSEFLQWVSQLSSSNEFPSSSRQE